MNDKGRLILKIGFVILLVVVVYMGFSFLLAFLVDHKAYVFEWQDLLVPVLLGIIAEYADILTLFGKGPKK